MNLEHQAPIVRRKLFQDIVERLQEMIHSGRYRVGDMLPSEREIMEAYGVGRTSVREALFALQRMGLVSISSGERARVTAPTSQFLVGELEGAARYLLAQPDGVRNFQQARMMFEIGLARYAAQHASVRSIELLRKALENNRQAIGDNKRFEQTDVAFHYVLATVPDNPLFTALHHAMATWLLEQRTTSIQARGSDRAAYRAHARIFTAIEERDIDGAGEAMRRHLDQVAKFYWRVRKTQ